MNVNYTSMPPQAALQAYMQNNGVSQSEAQAQLEAMFGKPGGPSGSQDPDAYAQQYANENNISLEEAKEALRTKYGDPIAAQEAATAGSASIFHSASVDGSDANFTSGIDDEIITQELYAIGDENEDMQARMFDADYQTLRYLGYSDEDIKNLSETDAKNALNTQYQYDQEQQTKTHDADYQTLRYLGYSDEDIKNLSETEARNILEEQHRKDRELNPF